MGRGTGLPLLQLIANSLAFGTTISKEFVTKSGRLQFETQEDWLISDSCSGTSVLCSCESSHL